MFLAHYHLALFFPLSVGICDNFSCVNQTVQWHLISLLYVCVCVLVSLVLIKRAPGLSAQRGKYLCQAIPAFVTVSSLTSLQWTLFTDCVDVFPQLLRLVNLAFFLFIFIKLYSVLYYPGTNVQKDGFILLRFSIIFLNVKSTITVWKQIASKLLYFVKLL